VTIFAALVWSLPALTAAGLGGWRLTGPALWADELATWGAVRLSWAQLWQLTGTVDAVLTPYYAVMKAYTSLAGTGTAALRLPTLVAVVATTVVVTAVGRRVGGDPVGLLAGLLYAFVPATARYAQEARPYALTMLFAALAVWFLIRLTDKPDSGRALVYAATVAATGLFHPLSAALMLVGHAAAMAWRQLRRRRDGWRTTWLWAAAAAVGSLPALVFGIRGARQTAQVSWITLVDENVLQGAPQHIFASPVIGGIILVLAVLGVRRDPATLCLIGAGFVPPALLLLVGTQVPVWVGRYVLVALPALAVLAGVGAGRAGRPQAAIVTALVALFSFPIQLEIRTSSGHAEDSAKIAQVIGPRYEAGDVAVFADTHPSIPWAARDIYERYLRAPRPPDVLRTTPQRTNGRLLARECAAAACLGTPPRIWVIRVDSPADPLKDMPAAKRAKIGGRYHVVQRWNYPLLGIILMERN
jgi:mannosyltransferase